MILLISGFTGIDYLKAAYNNNIMKSENRHSKVSSEEYIG